METGLLMVFEVRCPNATLEINFFYEFTDRPRSAFAENVRAL